MKQGVLVVLMLAPIWAGWARADAPAAAAGDPFATAVGLLSQARGDFAGDKVDVFHLADGIVSMKSAEKLMEPTQTETQSKTNLAKLAIHIAVLSAENNEAPATVRSHIGDAILAVQKADPAG